MKNPKNLSREEVQDVWDRCLLDAWYNEDNVAQTLGKFRVKICGEYIEESLREVCEFLVENEIRRFNGKTIHGIGFSMPIRALISDRCPRLSDCLWSGKHEKEFILENIKSFKWKIKRRKRKHKTGERNFEIKFRHRDKSSDWKTVK